MNLKLISIFGLIILMTTLSGCFGKMEINDLGMVMAVGLDPGEKKGSIRVSTQIVRVADARGQTGAPSGGTGDALWSATAEGDSIFSAIRELARFSSRRIFWAHNYIIVINEDLAREGIQQIIDFFSRNHELRMRTWVVVTPNKASEIVSTVTALEVIPGEAMDKLFRYSRIATVAPRTQLMDIQAAYLSQSTHPVIARVQLQDRGISNKADKQYGSLKQVELAGTGIFKDDKLIGILTPDDTRGLLFFVEKVQSAIVPLPCPDQPSKVLSLELKHQSFDIVPQYKNGKAEFDASLKTYVDLVEAGCPFSIEDQAEVKRLEMLLEKELASDIRRTVEIIQKKHKVDILELGKVFNNRYPAEWKKLAPNWDTTFPQVQVNIHVDARINSPVLLHQPTISGKEEVGK